MRLENRLLWPIPITLAVSKEKADTIKEGQKIALIDSNRDEVMGCMFVEEKYYYDKKLEAIQVFGTDDLNYPGVEKIYKQSEICWGGEAEVFSEGGLSQKVP